LIFNSYTVYIQEIILNFSKMKTFCLDTETSAGSRDGKIVQVAIVDESYREEWLINPESYIQP